MLKSTAIHDFPVLSNEDVQLLYDIITTAEESQSPPFRALFSAYDSVLAKYGLTKEHDQVYFRFLLRMREGRKPGDSLFRQFQSLLEKMDIHVDIDNEEDKENIAAQSNGHITKRESRQLSQTNVQAPSRRASFDSIYDTLAEERKHVDRDPIPRPVSTDIALRRSRTKLEWLQKQPDRDPLVGPPAAVGNSQHRKRPALMNRQENSVAEVQYGFANERKEKQPIVVYEQDGYTAESESFDSEDSDTEGDGPETNGAQIIKTAMEPLQKHLVKLESHSKALRYHQVAARAFGLFRQWRARTKKVSNKHAKMMRAAQDRDSTTLQRQAFEQWRSSLLEKRNGKEKEKMYDMLEQKATKARDMFLLSKAFTHWAECASEEVLRTAAARKQVLRIKYFNAWRDMTVMNELKVRRQVLVKFFGIWKSRAIRAYHQEEDALAFHETTTLERLYRHWFWHFCERRAPSWHSSRLKATIFNKWSSAAKVAKEREAMAGDFQRILLSNKVLLPWTRCLVAVQRNDEDATSLYRKTVLTSTVSALRRTLTYGPLELSSKRKIDSRVKQSAFDIWAQKTGASVRASEVDELRVMRNAWTMWNDKLRCEALQRSIDDRVVMQALYQWVLAERLALYERMQLERLRTRTFARWSSRASKLFEELGEAKHLVQERHHRRLSGSCLLLLVDRARAQKQDESRAQGFWDDHVRQHASQRIFTRSQQVQQMQTWAKDARFFVLSSTAIKKWRDAAESTRRAKRREAYTAFRRQKKMKQARRVLLDWRDRSCQISQLQAKAEQIRRKHTEQHASTIFYSLGEQLVITAEHTSQAILFRETRLLRTHFDDLSQCFDQVQDSRRKAEEFLLESATNTAAGLLRKFNWLLVQTKGQHGTAELLADRNRKKHYRHMLRYWAETATEKRRVASPSLPDRSLPASQRRKRATLIEFGVSVDQASTYDESFLDESTVDRASQLRTPAYLRTPSRRTNRGKARLPAPSTPATTQITPFLNRLQAHRIDEQPRSARGSFARRLLGAQPTDAIEDIPETSPLRRV